MRMLLPVPLLLLEDELREPLLLLPLLDDEPPRPELPLPLLLPPPHAARNTLSTNRVKINRGAGSALGIGRVIKLAPLISVHCVRTFYRLASDVKPGWRLVA